MYYYCGCCGYPYPPHYASCPRCLMPTPGYLRRKAHARLQSRRNRGGCLPRLGGGCLPRLLISFLRMIASLVLILMGLFFVVMR
jgi:hypothetical protein